MKPIIIAALVCQPFLVTQPLIEVSREPKQVEIVQFEAKEKLELISLPDERRVPVKAVTLKGDKYTWLKASGIPESEWTYVDYIIQHESGWNPNARNKTSGAGGLPQALPYSKTGCQWGDAVCQLRWSDNYAKSRYGSWYKAYTFWQSHRWW